MLIPTPQPLADEVTVLIVGAGPVGLGLAIELGSHGVRCQVVEQNDRVGYNPRAKLTNVRSMELLRRWGIAERLRAANPMPPNYPSNIVFATRLNGHLLTRFENAFYTARDNHQWYSESAVWVPQYTLEEVLLARACQLPTVSVNFSTRFNAFEETPEGIVANVRDLNTSRDHFIRCTYLVGADGGRSTVRELLNIKMSGLGAISPNFNVLFRAPRLASMHKLGQAIQYWMVNEDVPSLMGPMDRHGLWYLIATRINEQTDIRTIDAKKLIRQATGLDFEMEIIGTDPWVAHRLIADKYRKGNVFLVGDSCHLHPPFGGYGMNMGLGDAVDLGWKIAAVVQGWGDAALLDTYEIERKPVHERVMDEAVTNYSVVGNQLVGPDLERDDEIGKKARTQLGRVIQDTKLREFRSLGIVLGYRYKDSPTIIHDGTPPPKETVIEFEPSAHPGCLAPHFWLDQSVSLYDVFGPGFTLVTTDTVPESDYEILEQAASEAQVPLKTVRVPRTPFEDLYQARYALIRPDQHVAWRGNNLSGDAETIISRVRGIVH